MLLPPPPETHQTSKRLTCWGHGPGGPATFHELIARDKEVVKSVLLLTGSVEGIKNQARVCLAGSALGFVGVCMPCSAQPLSVPCLT
jgi:hypothetical protein